MRQGKAVGLVIAVVSLLTVGTGIAAAHTFRADSEVTIRYNDDRDRFQGRVNSERPSCERNRIVVVFRDNPGQDSPVGSDRTNDNGFWAVEQNNPQGDFYARVLRRERTSEGHTHICRGDRSETISLGSGPPGQIGNTP
jgi:hypothetical protein